VLAVGRVGAGASIRCVLVVGGEAVGVAGATEGVDGVCAGVRTVGGARIAGVVGAAGSASLSRST
jgi:hypothetical protein